ncbi:hypothetical protein H4R20_000037 [Coemansia guatemalensis]|uniref:SH3 domain-containing protein n=1 Tax=Coemansia guatemalensis TaxID=2761395 RepID=A0A9W8LX05_9FUNG|nr:hypothetical protein H4R20_000037 [Coemansia guatemalensis]
MRARPLYACEAENAGEVSFAANDQLTNVTDSPEDGWLLGTVQSTGSRGLFPAVYTELIPESGDDVVFLRKLQAAGLLSSAMQMDALRRDLDNSHISTTTTQSYSSSSSMQQSTYSSSVSYSDAQQQQGPQVPARPVGLTSRPAAIAAVSSSPISSGHASSRASPAPPPISSKPRPVVSPSQPASVQARASWQQQQQASSSSVNISSNLQEESRQQEIDAARAWEESHLAKKPTSLDGSREIARLVGGSSAQATRSSSATANNGRPAVPPKPLAGSSAVVSQEKLDQERSATASWEQKHLARNKAPVHTSEPRDVSQLFGGGRPAAPKPSRSLGTKPVVSLGTKPVVSLGTKPIVSPRAKAPVSPPSHQQQPLKPVTQRSAEEESRYDEERKAAASWEAKHGIGSARSSSAAGTLTKPVFSNGSRSGRPAAPMPPSTSAGSSTMRQSTTTATHAQESRATASVSSSLAERASNPATENDPPPLPYSAVRAARELEQKPKPVRHVNPATANDAPALPYSPTRATGPPVPEKQVDGSALPSSRQLISRMNSQSSNVAASSNSTAAATAVGFADNFEPAARSAPRMSSTSSFSSESSMQRSITTTTTTTMESTAAMVGSGAGIPLTTSHQVKGVMPFTGRASPASRQQQSYTSSKSFSQQKQQQQVRTMSSSGSSINSNNPTTTITPDALKRYKHLYGQLNKEDGSRGYLTSEKVRQVLASSRLPEDQLRRIWQLADRNNDGRFDRGAFNIAMYLVDCALRGDPIPEYLPIDLLHSAYA